MPDLEEEWKKIDGVTCWREFEANVEGASVEIWSEKYDVENPRALFVNGKLVCTFNVGMGQGTGYMTIIPEEEFDND